MDLLFGGGLLVVVSPVLGVLAVLVRWRLGRPVFFRQERSGRDGGVFVLWKLRTMTPERDGDGLDVPEEQRITSLGRVLRTTSLDELPQLWHVVVGHMSLVGPRPLLPEYDSRYSPDQLPRLLVRPGLTGLAQVNGRNALTWEEKFRLDVQYVKQATPGMDLRILLSTLGRLVRPSGVSSGDHATSPVFMGSESRTDAGDDVGRPAP